MRILLALLLLALPASPLLAVAAPAPSDEAFPREAWSSQVDLVAAVGQRLGSDRPPFDPAAALPRVEPVQVDADIRQAEHLLMEAILALLVDRSRSDDIRIAQATATSRSTGVQPRAGRESDQARSGTQPAAAGSPGSSASQSAGATPVREMAAVTSPVVTPNSPVSPEIAPTPPPVNLPVLVASAELDADVVVAFRDQTPREAAEVVNVRFNEEPVVVSNSARNGAPRWVRIHLGEGRQTLASTRYQWDTDQRSWRPMDRGVQLPPFAFEVRDTSRVMVIEITVNAAGADRPYGIRTWYLRRDQVADFPGLAETLHG